jgi:predicted DNA-binding transcriptional regulator AlpA
MERLLTVAEVLDLLQISRPTLGRYVKLARQGESNFPLPLQTGAKTKRLWLPAAIEQWSECRQSTPVTTATAILSPSKQAKAKQKRQAQTAAILVEHGINVNLTKKEN